MSHIENYRADLIQAVKNTCQHVREERSAQGYISELSFSQRFRQQLQSLFVGLSDDFPIESFEFEFIERSAFQADIAFKSTKLLSEDKAKYFKEYCPQLVQILQGLTIDWVPFFAEVRSVGIYVNARLPDSHFFQALEQVVRLDAHFGKSDEGRSQNIAIDYSSPNAAKHLHAGHIRSTIIGHVLGNMYEACGYTVHRINYLNDWGGMGVLIEGLSLRDDEDSYENKNDLLFEIYSTFRKAQKLSADESAFEKLLESEKEELSRLVGEFAGYEDFVRKYAAFSERANARFAALETGDDGEFATWRKIVEWSILDFERFYQMLDIHQEYLTGESLYAQSGKDFVMRQVEKGGVIFFDEQHAREALAIVQAQQEAETITSEVFERKKQEIEADIGCYVVPIGNDERYVVLKKDGSTIYATRDLAALEHRISVFSPKKLVYEVGQEQQEHFDKLFRAARQLGMVDSDVELLHIYHGFYVDEATKKKLSSRDWASNIMKLLQDTVEYFYSKYDDSEAFTEAEKRHIAKTLWVGSVIFNDIKKDKKSSVSMSADFATMMKQFEESGWAYLIYTSCRARSILRKYAKPLPETTSILASDLKDIEVDLLKKILAFPEAVKRAANTEDPVKIAEHITSIATLFNSYYNSTPILKGDRVEQGIVIAHCASLVINNGLRMLHIGMLERI